MQAVIATPGAPRPTELRTVAAPEPEPGDAVVAVRAFSVNRGELSLLGQAGENLAVLLDLMGTGRLQVELGFHEGWEHLNDALEALGARQIAGKAVLSVTADSPQR